MHIRSWLFPPDPSINHNIARGDHLEGTASWFTEGDMYSEWTAMGSLFWIHGKRTHFSHFSFATCPDCHLFHNPTAGSGKSILWYVILE